ncbi:polysaccharide biosynthesis protein [Pelagibacterales bacterium SAG-MED20]|nr:polysaccharide biosynthesis protein [Pelagibacterales bacterium SAG-MED20]
MKKTYFITGGTGSFAKKFIKLLINKKLAKKIIVFSRDEYKQLMMQELPFVKSNLDIFRFYLGDVRDKSRLEWAIQDSVDIVVHSAALKQVPATEYNPFETVQTNIIGTQNLIEVCINKNIDKVILISTDKAVSPINLYGSTKLTAEKLFISANIFKGLKKTKFSVIRYGNVMGSRGSVIPIFLNQNKSLTSPFTVTDKNMTRFNISLTEAANFVNMCILKMKGSEVFVPKIPSYKILDLVKAINPKKKIKFIGIRPGEKIHEELIEASDSNKIIENKNYFIISFSGKLAVKKTISKYKNFNSYNSLENSEFLSIVQIRKEIKKNIKDFD